MTHPDIPEEQGYFDRALELRDRLEANLGRAASLAADAKTATELRRRVGAMGVVDPGGAVAFGRIDANGDRWYIGKGAIWDEDNELVVVNWQAPIAAPFYTACPDDPEGLDRRRIFQCENNCILDIDEMVFNGLERAVLDRAGAPPAGPDRTGGAAADADPLPARPARAAGQAPGSGSGTPPDRPARPGGTGAGDGGGGAGGPDRPPMSDALLAALDRTRSGELGDIVATIQAAQYDIITREIEQLLVVQGGPGTGKTVVGLHRVSWMLYHRRERWQADDVLIVGPNPAFIRYISAVLPALGEEAVVQLPVSGLGPRVPLAGTDPLEVRRLKGDRRMLRLLLRAVRNRQKPQRGPIDLKVAGRTVRLDGDRIVARAQQLAGRPHNETRRELRSFVIDEVQTFFTRRGLRGLAAIEDMAQSDASREIDNYLERIWPAMTPQSFLVDLFSTRRRLEAAGLGLLTAEEISMLSMPSGTRVSGWSWSLDDVPLLDLVDSLLNGTPTSYEHIVVDEAQDLSPMQFEAIRRRSRTGWITVLGDLAQATSPWAPTSWEEVALHLRRDRVPTEITELSLGYRLPQEVHDVAMRLLPEIAPRLREPDAVRPSGHPVMVTATRPDELADQTVDAVRDLLGTGLIGVIAARRDRHDVGRALDAAGFSWAPELHARAAPIVLLAAEEAKGLEFDNVVVVEPSEVAGESPQGLRALFVALTRTTSRLSLVHSEPLPASLELDSPLPPPDEAPPEQVVPGQAWAERPEPGPELTVPGQEPEPEVIEPASFGPAPGGAAVERDGPWSPAWAATGRSEGPPRAHDPPDRAGEPRSHPDPRSHRDPYVTDPGAVPQAPPHPGGEGSGQGSDGPVIWSPAHAPPTHRAASTNGVAPTNGVGGPGGGRPSSPATSDAGPFPPRPLHGPAANGVPGGGDPGPTPGGAGAAEDVDPEEVEALAALDGAMARAIAGQLAETLARYVTPALVPLVLEEMGRILGTEAGGDGVRVLDVRAAGGDPGPGGHDDR